LIPSYERFKETETINGSFACPDDANYI